MTFRVMDFLRFPLIVLVVFIHSNPECIMSPWSYGMPFSSKTFFTLTQVGIQKVIAATAVPGFFFMSGYLFFYNVDNYNLDTYLSKLHRRIWTLLIPYLLWNTFPVIYPLLLYFFRDIPYSFSEWLSSYWDAGGDYHFPANFPLWYVRDLMVACLMTPVFWFLIKRLGGKYSVACGRLCLWHVASCYRY